MQGARFGVLERCVQRSLEEAPRKLQSTLEEGGRDARPLKGAHTQFWESGEEVQEPDKGEKKIGNWGRKMPKFPSLSHSQLLFSSCS